MTASTIAKGSRLRGYIDEHRRGLIRQALPNSDRAGDGTPPPRPAHAMVRRVLPTWLPRQRITLTKGIDKASDFLVKEDRGASRASPPIPTPSPAWGTISAGRREVADDAPMPMDKW